MLLQRFATTDETYFKNQLNMQYGFKHHTKKLYEEKTQCFKIIIVLRFQDNGASPARQSGLTIPINAQPL